MFRVLLRRFLFFAIVVIAVLCGAVTLFLQAMQKPLALPEEGVNYTLRSGASFSSLVYDLSDAGLLTTPKLFVVYGRLTGLASGIQAGEYHFAQGTTTAQLFEQFKKGRVTAYELTFVEGWRFSELLSYLNKQQKLQSINDEELQRWLDMIIEEYAYDSIEGLIYPDTYQYVSGTNSLKLLQRGFERMQSVLEDEWQKREKDLPYETPYEALIMASLIEKETGVAAEREQIAGVFVRRLQKRMRLQTDPTVIYGLGESFDGNLRSKHLKDKANIYNTYRHNGLPPTPIAMAGREAIHAALHPAAGDSLYFVAKGDGSHYFSATLEEHNKAVRQYQIYKRRKDYQSAPSKP